MRSLHPKSQTLLFSLFIVEETEPQTDNDTQRSVTRLGLALMPAAHSVMPSPTTRHHREEEDVTHLAQTQQEEQGGSQVPGRCPVTSLGSCSPSLKPGAQQDYVKGLS